MIIIYTNREDNKLHIVIPASLEQLKLEIFELTEDNYMQFILNKDVPKDAINPMIVPRAVLPDDIYFRNAWYQEGDAIKVNIPLARKIHLNNLRVIRNQKLNALDKLSLQAIERKDDFFDEIAKKKQELRDFTVTYENDLNDLNDLNKIKNFMPEILLMI